MAIIANVLLVMFLLGTRGWWLPMTLGVPLIVAPVLAIVALVLVRRN